MADPCSIVADGILFFSKSATDLDRIGVSSAASSNPQRSEYVRDSTNYRYWISDGSDDSTTETLTLTFENQSFDRIHLIDHNLKEFTIQYWDGVSAFVDFSTPIAETINEATTSYYEFDSVTTTSVRITMEKTIAANAEKRIAQFLQSTQLHKLEGYPTLSPRFDVERITKQTIRGRRKSALLDETFSASLAFQRYPVASDLLFFKNLWDNRAEFLVWPCAGKESIFRFNIKGTRLSDIYLCELDGNYDSWFDSNTYVLGVNGSINIVQVN